MSMLIAGAGCWLPSSLGMSKFQKSNGFWPSFLPFSSGVSGAAAAGAADGVQQHPVRLRGEGQELVGRGARPRPARRP